MHMLRMFALAMGGVVAVAGAAAPVVTIYSGGYGLISETRSVLLAPEGELLLEDLPLTLLVDSLVVEGLTATRIAPQWTDLPAVEGLVGSPVTVFTHGERLAGRLLATQPALVLSTAEGLVFLPSYDRIVAAGEAASARGLALAIRYRTEAPGPATVGLRYLAEGLSWHVTYTASLEDELVLRGMATFANRTGVDFAGATVSLVAGDVYRPAAKVPDGLGVRTLALAPEFSAVEAFEYHRYAFPEPVDLTQGVALAPLLSGTVPYTRAYRFAGGAVAVRVRFTNALAALPAGEVRFYDEGGELFVGAATLDHTPLGGEVDLAIGAAFDLTGERVQEARERITENLYRDTYRITLRSAKEAPVEVEVVETLPGVWAITDSTLPHERLDAQRVLFRVPVPASGQAEVRYTVEWRY